MSREELKDQIRVELDAIMSEGVDSPELFERGYKFFQELVRNHPIDALLEAMGDHCYDEARKARERVKYPNVPMGLADFIKATTPSDHVESEEDSTKRRAVETVLRPIRGEIWKRCKNMEGGDGRTSSGRGFPIAQRLTHAIETLLSRKYGGYINIPITITLETLAKEIPADKIRTVLGSGRKTAEAWQKIRGTYVLN